MELGFGRFGFTTALLFLCSSALAEVQNNLQIQYLKYAPDTYSTVYLSDKLVYSTGNFVSQLNLYTETGPKGSWSFDPDPIRITFHPDEANHTLLFFGREHPLNYTRDYAVDPYGALGSIWGQNQLEALNPRVSGWIGAGFVQDISDQWKVVGMYSPVFLPTFGPSLGFNDGGDLNPARFTRLPPASADTGNVTVPIRYQVQVGDLSRVVFQQQGFLGVNLNTDAVNFDVYGYTAPKPDVVALTDAKLAVNNVSANARVTITPEFPREYWSGMRMSFKKIFLTPALEFVQNLRDYPTHIASLTAYFETPQFSPYAARKTSPSTFGILTHFQRDYADPNLSDFLIFLKVPINLSDSLRLNEIIESTMLSMRQSFFWVNQFEYIIHKNYSLTAGIRVLSGQDHSYFGDWRDQDSYSLGAKIVW